MNEKSASPVQSFMERAYVRLKTGEVLIHCIEKGNAVPMQQMVENLVLAGPESLGTFREVLSEVSSRRSQLEADVEQVYLDLVKNLEKMGIIPEELMSASNGENSVPEKCNDLLKLQPAKDESRRMSYLQLVLNTQEITKCLLEQINLIGEIERYLEDWLWGLIYQSVHDTGLILISDEKSSGCH
jgi:hypothetical protein